MLASRVMSVMPHVLAPEHTSECRLKAPTAVERECRATPLRPPSDELLVGRHARPSRGAPQAGQGRRRAAAVQAAGESSLQQGWSSLSPPA